MSADEPDANPFSAEAMVRRSLQTAGALEGMPRGLTARTIEILYQENETLVEALERIKLEARAAVDEGTTLLYS